MTETTLRRALLGRGFAGDVVELSGLQRSWSCSFADIRTDNPFTALRSMEAALEEGEVLVGWISYEGAMALELGLDLPSPPLDVPACWLGVFSEVKPAGTLARPQHVPAPQEVDAGHAPEHYSGCVQTIRERITAGDVFQVNYSHRQSARFAPSSERVIDALPWVDALEAPYGAFFDLGDISIVSASPELFLSLDGQRLAAEPVKGTRPRHSDPKKDAESLRALQADPKDRAENIMITDLLRNDLSKVSEDGSVVEPVVCGARAYPHVHHLYSRVEGKLRKGLLFADALAAAFPCGSITGAPKLAAMDIIAELEGEGRGPYCGTIFSIPRGGKAKASVAIRTAVVDERTRAVHSRSGGGVTILSDPEAEYREAIDKGYLFRHLAGQDDPDRR